MSSCVSVQSTLHGHRHSLLVSLALLHRSNHCGNPTVNAGAAAVVFLGRSVCITGIKKACVSSHWRSFNVVVEPASLAFPGRTEN